MSKQKTTSKASSGSFARQPGLFSLATTPNARVGSARLSAGNELHRLSQAGSRDAKPISFGAPSSSGTQQHSAGSVLQDLMGSNPSKSVGKLLSGGILDLVTGSLFSGLTNLFGGGKSAPPPLTRFSLPGSINQTLQVSESAGASFGAQQSSAASPNVTYSDRNAEIVKAVKDALLTSSSLNDVISEI